MEGIMAIILAAGKGTRMKSRYPKVLHRVFGQPMVSYVLESVQRAGIEKLWVVIGYQADTVKSELEDLNLKSLNWVCQEEQLGTGHAVRMALECIERKEVVTLILCGDTPLLRPETITQIITHHQASGASLTILTAILDNPRGYGRVLRDEEGLPSSIVEERDATAEEKEIREVNTGIYCIETGRLEHVIGQLEDKNAQSEFYLTDIVHLIRKDGGSIAACRVSDPEEIEGVNDRIDLALAHRALQKRRTIDLLKSGVTIYQPENIYLEKTVHIGKDSIIFPYSTFLGTVDIGENCRIASHCCLKNAAIGNNVDVGFGSILNGVSIASGSIIPPHSRLMG